MIISRHMEVLLNLTAVSGEHDLKAYDEVEANVRSLKMPHPPIKHATSTMNFVDQQVQGANVDYCCSMWRPCVGTGQLAK